MPERVDAATYSNRPIASGRGRTPRATPEQVAAWRALARAFAAARERMAASLEGSWLDISEYDVLVTIAQGPRDGVRPTDLAGRVLLTKSGMTRLLDRLDERGLVARLACPTDGRAQLIALTAGGRSVLRRAAPSLMRALGSSFGGLSEAELVTLRRLAERITATVSSAGRPPG